MTLWQGFVVLAIISIANNGQVMGASNITTTISNLFKKLQDMQATRYNPGIPPLIWTKFSGVYESDVKMYFHGAPEDSALRYSFGVFDNNMFATAWVTTCLIEAHKYGKAPKPTTQMLDLAINFIMDHRNKNAKYNNSIMAFWPQLYDETYKDYTSTPVNLLGLFNTTYLIDWDPIYKELDSLGLQHVTETIKHLLERRDGYRHVFHIPPDFDDTSVNLGLGSLLKEYITDFPDSSVLWQTQNSNLSSIFNALKHYAYKPTTNDSRVNTIDTRTYFYMRRFLQSAKSERKPVALITTWIQDFNDLKTEYNKGVVTPGDVNNVDVTVSANALYGITNSILSGLVTTEILEDPEIQQIYLNTSTMITFQINTNFSSRPDLALTYYPSVMEFYWFVARTYNLLNRRYRTGGLPHPAMTTVLHELEEALCGTMTKSVIKEATFVNENVAYYDDFLGNGDVDENGQHVKYGEDRLFTTSMAINALITTWTLFNVKTGQLHWNVETPVDVKKVVSASVSYLNEHILSGEYKPWNTFFSGSVKGHEITSSSRYPNNRNGYINGTKIHIRGMEGVVNDTWYEQQLKTLKSPIDFHGFNSYPDYFPFWCSEPYTYVTSMLALSTFNNIAENDV
ncbi:uncharacterized protein LOC133204863 [Saccostrea echinata]|uniref:uncharacterized protein LOC133204863 n=1 Tax=Saccostrea echinata TaxID=191078 RepID=UPI002A82436E|nr:uncharacterized protein LOC133204863 [Saccostrea echinata]